MSTYKISVTNYSGTDQTIAIYQEYPDLLGGLPLVWLTQTVNKGNETDYEWELDWGLNWGTSKQKLAPGILWQSKGPLQKMEPNTQGANNAMGITYQTDQFKTQPEAYCDSDVPQGDLLVTTDQTFSVAQANLMSIAVYMNNIPAFAVHGKPNGKYLFETHPTYFICVTEAKQGVAVSSTYVSSPKEIIFTPGHTSLSFTLNDKLQFIQS